jgi:membrane protease YdiL (CAAX protease family)
MSKSIIESFIHFLFILPLILFFVKKWDKGKIFLLGLFLLFFITNQFLLKLPIFFSEFNFTKTWWNFSGKIYAIFGSLLLYFIFQKHLKTNDYITVKQTSLKPVLLVFLLLIVLGLIEAFLFYNMEWDSEKLLFQLTMPGIDEELMYRGLLLGVLTSLIIDEIKILKFSINPSLWIIGILFGLIHGLTLNENFGLEFKLFHFLKTFVLGTIWGWMTVKSRSILLPIISHNLSNFIPNFIGAIK